MGFNDFFIHNNGDKKQLGDIKHGVRREQLDAKFHPLFDTYDYNKDGTLENDELGWLLGALKNAAGDDNTLDDSENSAINALFKKELNINDANFKEFTLAISNAAENIKSIEEFVNEDGSKSIKTIYDDGTIETINYYPDGSYKSKKIEKFHSKTQFFINSKEVSEKEYNQALKNPPTNPMPKDSIGLSITNISKTTTQIPEIKEEFSTRFEVEKILDTFCTGREDWEVQTIKQRFFNLIDQYPEQEWTKITQNIKDTLKKNNLEPSFDNVADALETLNLGMTLRNEQEWDANAQRREELELRQFAASLLAYIFEIAGAMQQDYHDNQGLADFAFYAEQLNDIICKLGGETDYTRSYAQAAKNCQNLAQQAENLPILNNDSFNADLQKLNDGKSINIEALKKLKEIVSKEGFDFQKDIYSDEFNNAVKEVFGNSLIQDIQSNINTNSIIAGVGDILIMLMTLGAAAEAKGAQIFSKATMQAFSKAGAKLSARALTLSNPIAKNAMKFAGKTVPLGAPMLIGGTQLASYTGAKETINNFTNPTRDALSSDTWKQTADAMTQSFGFGSFGGLWGSTITTRVMNMVSRSSSKTMAALAPKFAQGSVKATDVLQTLLQKSADPGKIAQAAAFLSEVIGFTAYESALKIFVNLDDNITLEELTDILWEEFKNQGFTLGQIKALSMFLMGSKGARAAQMEAFKDSFKELQGVEVIPKENQFFIKTPEGKVFICENEKQMLSACALLARGGVNQGVNQGVSERAGESELHAEKPPVTSKSKPKFKTEITTVGENAGVISRITENGENAGLVNYNLITKPNGEKVLHFEGLEAKIKNAGVGTKLISELIKLSHDLGAEGRIEATASISAVIDGKPVTNLEFYYKMGFRAVDPKIDAQIKECLEKGQEIPVALNYNVKLEYKNTKPVIDKAVAEIQAKFDDKTCDEIVSELYNLGFGDADNMVHRAKSYQSLFDKIKNYLIDNPGASIESAIKSVRDGFGARRIVESGDFASKTSGTMDERINQAIEMQSQAVFDAIKNNIDALANSKDGLGVVRISNYTTADGKYPYLTQRHYDMLKDYAAERGIDFSGNELIDPYDPKASEVMPFMEYEGGITKKQPSGYPALQMNFVTKDGKVIEYQFRGDRINVFAEGEHLHYDLFSGKEIIKQNPELEPLYGPIKGIFESMSKEVHKDYLRYWQDYNIHLRKLELGFESTEPKLEDYGNFDTRISAKNLVLCHELGEKVKKGKITQDEAVREFNNNIDNNTQYYDIRLKVTRGGELADFKQNLDAKIQEFSWLDINEKYREKILEIASNDIELANKFLENMKEFHTSKELDELSKAASIDRELTIELLGMKTKLSWKEKLKNKEPIALFHESYSLIEVVKSAQKDKAPTLEFLSKVKERGKIGCISDIVELAKLDKELALEIFSNKNILQGSYKAITEALKIDKNLTKQLLKKDKYNNLHGSQIVNIVLATKANPKYMAKAEQEIIKNNWTNNVELQDYSEIAFHVLICDGELIGKTYEELTDIQKAKLQNYLINITTSTRTSDAVKERFPILPKDLHEYKALMKRLNNDLSSINAKQHTPDVIKSFNNALQCKFSSEAQLKEFIDKYIPDFKCKSMEEIINMISKVIEKAEFQKLSAQEQNIVLLSAILSNNISAGTSQKDIAFQAYKTALQYGYSKTQAEQIFQIVKNANLIETFMNTNKNLTQHPFELNYDRNNREAIFDRIAFDLKDGNTFTLAKIVYQSRDIDGLTRHLDKKLETRIQEMKADDFMLPQTPASVYKEKSTRRTIHGYNVNVVYASDIENFYAYVHNPHGISFLKGDMDNASRYTKLDGTDNITSERVMCVSYISNDNLCATQSGFIYEASANNQHVATGHDIESRAKNTDNMLAEYYTHNNVKANSHNHADTPEYKIQERQMVAKNLKEILNISDSEYIQRLDNIKTKLGDRIFTLEEADKIDPEFASAYRTFLSRTNYDSAHGLEALMSNGPWNEAIISKGKLRAIYAVRESDLNNALLEKAQEEGLTIVILKKN